MSRRRDRVLHASVGLALAWLCFPGAVQATGSSATASALCVVNLTVTVNPTATVMPPALPSSSFSIATTSGTCYGASTGPSGTGFSITVQGVTVIDATCEESLVLNTSMTTSASVIQDNQTYPVIFDLIGPTAAPSITFYTPPGQLAQVVAGTGQLVLQSAPLQACVLNGTGTLQYTGAVALFG